MLTDVRKRVRKTVFKKGVKPYIMMLIVILIFSFLSAFYSLGTKEVKTLDDKMSTDMVEKSDVDDVESYILSMSVFDGLPDVIKTNVVKRLARFVAKSHPTVLNSLSSNQEYFESNMDEVVLFLILGMVVFGVIKFFLTRPFLVGEYRYLMEARFQRDVKIRRIFAPFGSKKFFKVYFVNSRYNLVTILWWLTIVGGVYKNYQYYFVRQIVAENPNVTWKQARDLSKAMTDGYKFTIFKIKMSYLYLTLLRFVPFLEFFVETPIRLNVDVEMYFWLRQRPDIDRSLFIEKAFDEKPYIDRIEEGEKPEDIKPEYLMEDFSIRGSSFDENDHYSMRDYIFFFFLFSFAGWLWELSISLFEGTKFVNSDSLYGPWLSMYGLVAIILIAVLSRFKNNKIVFVVATVLLSFVVEAVNCFMAVLYNIASHEKHKTIFASVVESFNIYEFLVFVILGFLCIYIIAPHIKNALDKLGDKRSRIIYRILLILFVCDVIISAIHKL